MSLFEDLQSDPLLGTEVMGLLEVSTDDMKDPSKFEKLRDVIEYVGNVPERRFFINKAVSGKNVDKLDHVFGLVQLHRQKDQKEVELRKLDEEISFFNK